jgi:serine/threonine-protein kinase
VSERSESKLLDDVAGSICDGEPIDWEQVERSPVDEQDSGALRELHAVEKIAAFYRNPNPSSMPTDPSGRIDRRPSRPESEEPRTWGHLTVVEAVGAGTFATVYRARDDRLQSDVALKLVKAGVPANPSKALEEARILARVRHPNVVAVYGADLIDGQVGVWMEFVKGRTLADLLRTGGPFSAGEATLVGQDLCRALAAVHAADLIHGDVKAHNVMRAEGGRTVLMDFGTGKDLNKEAAHARGRASDDFAGTPLYLPPEVFEGRPRAKVTDIYSLGVLLYHLVTDAYPVQGRTRDEVEEAHRRGERRHLRDLRPDLPDEFIRTVERALSPDPAQRYQSAGAFEAALVGSQIPQPPRTRAGRVAAVGLVAAILIVGGVLFKEATRPARPASGATAAAHTNLEPSATNASADPAAVSYRIEPAFYRGREGEGEVRLRAGSHVAPGDRIFARIRTSVPTYVYIVNEDERGAAYLEFPLPGRSVTNPLAADQMHRIPGRIGDQDYSWQVDTAGGQEHFIVFASPQPLGDFEQSVFAALPRPEVGKPILAARLSDQAAGALRSVGGLAAKAETRVVKTGSLIQLFAKPLEDKEETAQGLWVRQLTINNPVKE